MKFPLGDVLRSFFAPDSFLGKILGALKGTKITTKGGSEILLNEGHGVNRSDPAPFNKPHTLEPPKP